MADARVNTPVALGLGGVAALLVISGIQGKSLGDILNGNFGKAPDPGFKGEGGEEHITSPTNTEPSASSLKAAKGLISPFPKGTTVIWGQTDKGIDGQVPVGTQLRAMGNGTVTVAHDPSGFGANYVVLHVDGDGSYYYGHSIPAVASGQRVAKGQTIARAHPGTWGNSTTPGGFEFGEWGQNGPIGNGAAFRPIFTKLPQL